MTDFADQIIAALEGPRGPEIAELIFRRASVARCDGISTVQAVVAKHYGCGVSTLRGRRKDRLATEPRSVAVYLARKLTGASYPQIGRAFCRDHTTARAAYLSVERKIETDADLRGVVQALREALGNTDQGQGLG